MAGYLPDNQHTPRGNPSPAEVEKVRSIQELFKGRFPEDGIAELLQYLKGDLGKAAAFLCELGPGQHTDETDPELLRIRRRLQNRLSDDIGWIFVQAKKGTIKTAERLFACGDCNKEWWFKVPQRKQVSKCQLCRVRYDPIPHEYEWGWATFNCPCGNTFSGFGQMNKTQSSCFRCKQLVKPTEVRRSDKHDRRSTPRRSSNTHQCSACSGGAQGAWNQQCVHPRSRQRGDQGRPTVLMASKRHVSTGSTVDTFLHQADFSADTEIIFEPPIPEEDESGEYVSPVVSSDDDGDDGGDDKA